MNVKDIRDKMKRLDKGYLERSKQSLISGKTAENIQAEKEDGRV